MVPILSSVINDQLGWKLNTMKIRLGMKDFRDILRRGDALYGIECKRADTLRITRSTRIALDDLKLKHVFVIYPGIQSFPLAHQVEAVPLKALSKAKSLGEGF
jgi:hypothetical protein